ncbi:MAG: prolyl oligopeptidase family serine peptidase [Kiritimatiellae bacterium]|nr:prolyl oligopeptidase family serine peptidase [Kiritimatiellia bacterium]
MDLNEANAALADKVVPINPHQLDWYMAELTLRNMHAGDLRRGAVMTPEDAVEYQRTVRDAWSESLGPIPADSFLSAQTSHAFERDGLYIESIILETRPGFFATAVLAKPTGTSGKLPAVLQVCGHSELGRTYPPYQNVMMTIAKAGFAVMTLDSIGQGERITYMEDGISQAVKATCPEHDYAGIQCLITGMNISEFFVHDALCALDYLESRDDIDPQRIGVTGCSGGGTLTAMLMMQAPERIAAAAPCCFITTREDILRTHRRQDLEQIWPGMAAAGLDHADAVLCMAPKPVMLLTADSDFFPIEGSCKTLEKARPFWRILGNPDGLEMKTDRCRHGYSHGLANAAADFFSRALRGEPAAPVRPSEPVHEGRLNATPSGSVVQSLGSRIPHDYVVDKLAGYDREAAVKTFDTRRREAVGFIRAQIDAFPAYPLYLKRADDAFYHAYDLRCELFLWYQQENLSNFGIFFHSPGEIPLHNVLALWDGGTLVRHRHMDEVLALCHEGKGVFIVDLAGTGCIGDDLYHGSEPDYFWSRLGNYANNLLVNGDNLPAMRVRGILRAIDAVQEICGTETRVDILTRGGFNLYALMAKLVDERIYSVIEHDPVESFRRIASEKYYNDNNIKAYVMPSMLRYFDILQLREFVKGDRSDENR